MTTRDGEESQEINDISVIEERIPHENDQMESNETETYVRVEIKDEKRLMIDELKALKISNKTEGYLTFKKADQRKLRDAAKKVNAVTKHIETDDVTQITNLLGQQPFVLQKKLN